MNATRWAFLGGLLAGTLGTALAAGHAGHGSLQSERVALDNSRVRVIEYASRPGGDVCGIGTHAHPPHVTIVLAPARDRATVAGGKPEDADMKVGDVYWSDGETHTDVNIGRTSSRLIVVELK